MAVIDSLERMQGFTQTEKELARYILENLDDIAQMNIGDLAEATYTSTATVVRLCRKLGVGGYRDFRILPFAAKSTLRAPLTEGYFAILPLGGRVRQNREMVQHVAKRDI